MHLLDILDLLDEGFNSQLKGSIGEMTVDYLLSKLNKDYYFHLNNVLLPLKNGGTTQIDHLVLSPYGIFVIETKNYQGFIFGDEHQDYWTQKTYGGAYQFYNPIKQNDNHINVLVNLLNIEKKYFNSIILFVGECQLKTPLPNNVLVCNFLTNNLNAYIQKKNETIISEELFREIFKNLKTHRIKSTPQSEQQHKQYVKSRQNLCPKCKSVMVERVAKNTGQKFLGCSRFPQCRGTRPINEQQDIDKQMHKLIKFLL